MTAASAPGATGGPTFSSANFVCCSSLSRKLRKSAHAGGACAEHEKPSPPPKVASGLPSPPSTVGNGNQPSLSPKRLLVRGQARGDTAVPVALELHRCLAIGEQAGRAVRALLRRSAEEAVLERLVGEQLLQLLAGLHEAGIVESEVLARLLQRLLAAHARREVAPVERVRPLVLAAYGDRGDPRRLELVDGAVELVHRLWRCCRCRPSRTGRCGTRSRPARGCRGGRTACRPPASRWQSCRDSRPRPSSRR